MDIDYELLEKQIIDIHPKLIIVGASSYVKEFDYQKIHSIASRYNVPLMADICHSVLYIMGKLHKDIFPFVDFATFTMDKLLCGPQGGVLVYKSKYDSKITTSIFPKTQGGPLQNSLFAKAMCFLKLNSINISEYAKTVIHNANILLNELTSGNIKVINDIAYNHIILIDVAYSGATGKDIEAKLFKNGILVNRNQIPNDTQNALTASGIRIGTVPITNLNYSEDDIKKLGKYLAAFINSETPSQEIFLYLIEKYHKNINISN